MEKRLLNFTEYLKEELKIDLSDKKFKENLEALLVVADQAIYDYCNGSKKRPYCQVINELMDMDGYADSILYGVAAMLLSGMDRSELKDLKEGGEMPNVKLVVTGHDDKRVRVKKDEMYKSKVDLEKDGQKIPDGEFKIINAPGESGEMNASQFLIKITEKNTEDLVSSVEDKKTEAKEINLIKNSKNKFSFNQTSVYNPLKSLILIPPMEGAGTAAKLESKEPYLQASGSGEEEVGFKMNDNVKKESQFKTESAELKEGFAAEVLKEIEDKIENAKKEAEKKLGKGSDFVIKISDLQVISSASNVWGDAVLDPTEEMDFSDPSRNTTPNTKKNDELSKKRAESFENAIVDALREKNLLGKDAELSKKWKVTDTGGKTDDYNRENKTGKPAGQYVEVRMTLSAEGKKTEPGDLSAYLKYARLELAAGFYFGDGGENFLDMKGWEFSRPKYTRKGPFKNIDFGKSLNVRGLPWWLTKGKGGGGRDWIGGRS
jgi:hypothetical protein